MISKEYIEEEYLKKRRPLKELAEELGCSISLLGLYRKKYGIAKRERIESLCGQIFNNWEVIEKISKKDKNGFNVISWLCRCKCGTIAEKQTGDLKIAKRCRKCQGLNHRSKEIVRQNDWTNIVRSAIARNFKLDIDKKYVIDLFIEQDKKCALTGLPIYFSELSGKSDGTASLDRIDSKLGYSKNNCQFLHKTVNKMKQNIDEKTFLEFCKYVSDNNED